MGFLSQFFPNLICPQISKVFAEKDLDDMAVKWIMSKEGVSVPKKD